MASDEKSAATAPEPVEYYVRGGEKPLDALRKRKKALTPPAPKKNAQPPATNFFTQIDEQRFHKKSAIGGGDSITICCVSQSLKFGAFGPSAPRSPYLSLIAEGGHRVAKFSGDLNSWQEDRLAELSAALSYAPQIVSFGEFSYPPLSTTTAGGAANDAFAARVRQTLVDQNSEAFVFCGSHHSRDQKHVGVIFPYGHQRDHIKYIKKASTRSIGERVAWDPKWNFRPPAVQRPEGYVTVLMSSEIFDLEHAREIALRNVGEAGGHTKMDLVVVPSFVSSVNEPIETMCAYLSRWTATTVIYVNANSLSQGFPDTGLYLCGERLNKATSPAILTNEVCVPLRLPSGAGSLLRVFTLNRDEVDIVRRAWLASKEMENYVVPVVMSANLTRKSTQG